MAGLVPAIHAAPLQPSFKEGARGMARMPATSADTTRAGRNAQVIAT
jgi:hypothetical protein